MHFPWFKRVGIFFLPTSFLGFLVLLAGIVYSVYIFLAIDARSHSASDTLINFAFKFLIIAAVYSTIGFLTSKPTKK